MRSERFWSWWDSGNTDIMMGGGVSEPWEVEAVHVGSPRSGEGRR